ncbi:hypothetical protein M758_UG103700 [Ceratodon purpureus]|nr:hypothetical protein M758_UG103700 [Ceratodon purpureus]
MQQAAPNGSDENVQSNGETFRRLQRPTNTWHEWPTTPEAAVHLAATNTILIQWARRKGARGRQLELLSRLFDWDFLLSLLLSRRQLDLTTTIKLKIGSFDTCSRSTLQPS